jgi:hypothetical protein
MYSFQGCYKVSDDICLNNFFTINNKNSSSIGDCKNAASVNDSPFFAMTDGNIQHATCLLGKNTNINNNITTLSNTNNKVNIQNINNQELRDKPNICGFNNSNKKTDIYAGSNLFSLYTSKNTMLMYKNQDLLKKTYESPYYFNNWLKQLDNDFNNIINKIKVAYRDYLITKASEQDLNNVISNSQTVKNKNNVFVLAVADLISLNNQYNNLINNLVKNSKIVFEKLNVFKSSTGLLENELFNNKEVLDQLLNNNRGDNEELLNNKLKKYLLVSEITIITLITISLFLIKKK